MLMTAKEGLNIAQLMKAENIHTQRNHCAVCCKNNKIKTKTKQIGIVSSTVQIAKEHRK